MNYIFSPTMGAYQPSLPHCIHCGRNFHPGSVSDFDPGNPVCSFCGDACIGDGLTLCQRYLQYALTSEDHGEGEG